MNIAVIGAGYVGLVAAGCFANSGHKVVIIEKNKEKLEKMQNGIIPIYEEGLEEVFKTVTSNGNLTVTDALTEGLKVVSVVFIAVGSPSLPDGRIDLSQVYQVADEIVRLYSRPITVIMKSTVPPGTGIALNKRYFNRPDIEIKYVSNPEFLREGKAIEDWYNPDRIVIGAEDLGVADKVAELYQDINAPKVIMDVTSAEMVKYASNAFLATKISFINEIANLCERVGADIDDVSETIGMDRRIGSHFLKAGIGYGGSCFPKDTKGLDYISAFNGYNFTLLKSVIEINARQRIMVVRKLITLTGGISDKKVAVLGLAFKPGTDDIRESPALDIIDQLLNEGAEVAAYDPMAMERVKSQYPGCIQLADNAYRACAGAAVVILATEWPEFLQLDWKRIKSQMASPFIVFDGRNVLNQKELRSLDFCYSGIGRN